MPSISVVYKSIKKILYRLFSRLNVKDIILFESIPDYGDSSKEVFEYIMRLKEFDNFKIVWFAENPDKLRQKLINYKNVSVKKKYYNHILKFKYLYLESIAKYCLYTHYLIGNIYNTKQTRINLTHGAFVLKNLNSEKTNYVDFSGDTYTIATKLFPTNNRVYTGGLPRNDRLFDDSYAIKSKLDLDKYNKFFVWMPTFKHLLTRSAFSQVRNDFCGDVTSDISLQSDEFYEKVNDTLSQNDSILLIKYHPNQDLSYVSSVEKSNIKVIKDAFLYGKGISLYSLLGASDALITDFSSVSYDYLLINKPIGFELTDMEKYKAGIGMLNLNEKRYMPGKHIYNTNDFIDFVVSVIQGKDNYAEDREVLLNELHFYKDEFSTKRVVDFIIKLNNATN